MAKKGLGRGLDALMFENSTSVGEERKDGISMLRVAVIEPNPKQARKKFDNASLSDLAQSISRHGVLQPIVVRKKENGFYEIIAGERRWRACKMAGLQEIPALIKDVTDINAAELSLVENLQREDLNPVEEAYGYKNLIEQFGLTQEEAADKVGKARASVANMMRILSLPQKTLSLVEDGLLSFGHARTLVALAGAIDDEELYKTAKYVSDNDLSVRETEKLVKNLKSPKEIRPRSEVEDAYYRSLEKKIGNSLGRKIKIVRKGNGNGAISIPYFSNEDFEILINSICKDKIFE